MEQILNQRNGPWNTSGTNSLKALANKVLKRNKEWNTNGTRVLKPVPLRGTNVEINCVPQYDDLSYAFEERAAIMEYEGGLSGEEAERRARIDMLSKGLSNGL
jgi:hypothetical protein